MADTTVSDAQKLYQEALDAQRDQRRQMLEDIQFSDPSNPRQWDETVRLQRESDPGGKRPCLVMDQTGQYIANVAGQVEKQPPSLHAVPVGGGADKEAAEQIDGRFRHIEYASRATQHYTRAMTSAARIGVGYLIIRPEYVDRALNWQEPRISSEPDPLRVVLDPWSTETDGSDAQFGFLITPTSIEEFKRRWPGKEVVDFGGTESNSTDMRRSVLVGEQWIKVKATREVFVFIGPDGQETSGTEDEYVEACVRAGMQVGMDAVRIPYRTYKDETLTVKWRRMSGAEVLEETDYPAEDIGIVPIYGYVGFADGRMTYCGIARRGRAPQQAYNYHISELQAFIGTSLKSTTMASKRAIRGFESIWDQAQVQTRAFLPFNDLDEKGAIASPVRVTPTINLGNHEAGAAQALRDLQAAIGMYQANIGANSNVTSGIAYDAQKQQGEASTAHFPSHMAASLTQVGKILMCMDARLADTKREQPIIGVDGSAGAVTVDPAQQEAFRRGPAGASINPKVGKYGARVTIGASYITQRKETNAAFAEIMRGNPALSAAVAPFWAQTLDFPGSDKFAQAMAAMAPPAIKAILQPEGQDKAPDPAQLMQQIQQLQQALQQATQIAHEAQQDADEAIADQAAKQRDSQTKARELDIQAYNAETNRLKVTGANVEQIEAVVRDLMAQMAANPDPLPGGPKPDTAPAASQPASEPPAAGLPSSFDTESQQPAPETAPMQ